MPESGPRVPYSHELVTRTDVERHLQKAPAPIADPGPTSAPKKLGLEPRHRGPRDMTRPKEFQNHGRVIPRTDCYTEYPTMDYPYDNQTAKKGGFVPHKTPKGKTIMKPVDPGYLRTITDQNKHIQGVLYHPHGPKAPDSSSSSSSAGVSGKPLKHSKGSPAVGALYPSQEVFRAQTFGPRQTSGLPVSKS